MSIFKAYDIRGIVPTQLDEDKARRIGNAFAVFLKAKRIVVGRDCRTHGPSLTEATIQGVLDAGSDVADIGMVTTPMSYFAVGHDKYDGGLMVTASHNPPEYNGFKLCREQAIPISGDTGIADIERIVESGQYLRAARPGKRQSRKIADAYVGHVRSFAHDLTPLTVVVDGGNGVSGTILPAVVQDWPVRIQSLYLEPDGNFPNHEPNPLKPENTAELSAAVLRHKAHLGVAFDGDADRCAFVDERGERIPSDLITALMAAEALEREPGAAVVFDLRSSMVVREEIQKRGGKPVEERVGHSFLKATMRRHDAALGGELSGHYYFRENYYADSAMIAFVRVLSLVCAAKKPFSELIRPLARTFPTGELNFEIHDKDGKLEELTRVFMDAEISKLDGVTIRYPDWWANVRKSNTEPILRLNLEGRTAAARDQGKRRMLSILGEPHA